MKFKICLGLLLLTTLVAANVPCMPHTAIAYHKTTPYSVELINFQSNEHLSPTQQIEIGEYTVSFFQLGNLQTCLGEGDIVVVVAGWEVYAGELTDGYKTNLKRHS